MIDKRPWGSYEILTDGEGYKVKKIIVKPQQRLSYQFHQFRNELWMIVVENPSFENDLVFIEIQTGSYFGEDDIVRLEDDYNRK